MCVLFKYLGQLLILYLARCEKQNMVMLHVHRRKSLYAVSSSYVYQIRRRVAAPFCCALVPISWQEQIRDMQQVLWFAAQGFQ